MKKKKNIIIFGIILAIVIVIFLMWKPIKNWLYSSQYNENGISHFLVVTIDETQPIEFVGELEGYKIYVKKFNLKETNFRNVNAENVSIKEAIEEKVVSISEWKKYASRIVKDGDSEILKFDNYEIACVKDNCVIRPLSK